MSTTTTERRESRGIVGDALRRPIQEAVKEGVKEAIREDEELRLRRSGEGGDSQREQTQDGGGGRSKFAMFALLGIGVAAVMLWRRRRGGSSDGGGGVTESIREKAKSGESTDSYSSGTDDSGYGDSGAEEPDSSGSGGGGAVETTEQSDEAEDATPEATND